MNSEERLLAVIKGEEVDRVPISTYELVGWAHDDWYSRQPQYQPLLQLIREKTDCFYMWRIPIRAGLGHFINGTEEVVPQVEKWWEGDSLYTRTTLHTPLGPLSLLQRQDRSVNTVWTLERFVKDEDDIKRVLSIPYAPLEPVLGDFPNIERLMKGKGLPMVSIPDPLCCVAELFDFQDFLLYAISHGKEVEALLELFLERLLVYVEHALRLGIGPVYRIYGPEYATPPYLTPDHFRRFVVKYTKPLIDLIHKYGMYVRIHCHGKISKVLDDICALGPDMLEPVEPPPQGDITLAEAHRRVAGEFCLLGNIELVTLETASPEEVERLVKEAIDVSRFQRFVLMPTASPINADLQARTLRNYEVMIETAYEYGKY